jgi:hypothetical protein
MINIPPRPQLEEFPTSEWDFNKDLYIRALESWERVCHATIKANLEVAIHLANVNKEVK